MNNKFLDYAIGDTKYEEREMWRMAESVFSQYPDKIEEHLAMAIRQLKEK